MKWYWWVLVVLATLATISTVLPFTPEDTPDCLLGYPAHCSFTPISTGICLFIAVGLMFLGGAMSKKETKKKERDREEE